MDTTIYFYTGTGNSLWTARKLASLLGGAQLKPMAGFSGKSVHCDAESIGLIFPVHIWGVPPPVIRFIDGLKTQPETYVFSVAVHAGQVAETLVQLSKHLEEKNLRLAAGFSLELPSNYIVWRGAISGEKQQKKFDAAVKKMTWMADAVRNRQFLKPEKGPFWQNPFFSWIYRKSFPRIAGMDQSFHSDEKCNGCGICRKICPARNIRLSDARPVWLHHCEQCFACIQWCPEEAIQYGKNTSRKKRYQHPEVSLKDMLACTSASE